MSGQNPDSGENRPGQAGNGPDDDESPYRYLDFSQTPGRTRSSVFRVPVWHDEVNVEETASYFDGNRPSENRVPRVDRVPLEKLPEEPRMRRVSKVSVPDVPDSPEEAFRLIQVGVDAEIEGRYASAMRAFLDAGEMLTVVGENERDDYIRYLLHQKAMDVLGWTEALAAWLDGGRQGPVPRRMGRTVTAYVAGRKRHKMVAPVSRNDSPELTNLYYTSVSTKHVPDFTKDGYILRCVQAGRRPKLMVVVTMYNEAAEELQMTLRKIANNVEYIRKKELPGYDNDLAWQNVLVCVISDGRTKASKGTLEWLTSCGIFDQDAMTINSVGVDVQMHLFEYSLVLMQHRIHRGSKGITKVEEGKKKFPPLQVVFGLKEQNAGKLNSHEWYFNAFAEQIMPKYTILLDVGTMPTKSAFYRLLASMEGNANIGGVCGEIAVDRPYPNLCNWVIAAQHFEYKISNILDKSMESVFGFISVLPGAFSAYRYEAIRGPPLEAYFKSLTTSMKDLGPFQGNMYLAEDRILCFEIVARDDCKWKLRYVKNAVARTDVPQNLVSLIGQRRRWLNGSFFAILYTVAYWGRIYTMSKHSIGHKIAFMFQYFFNVIQVILNWLLISNFYLAVYFVLIRGFVDNNYGFMDTSGVDMWVKTLVEQLFEFTYGIMLLVQVIAGLGNKPKHFVWMYTLSALYFGIIMVFAFVIATLVFIFGTQFTWFTVGFAIAIIGVYFIASAFHCELHHIILSFAQYMFLLPTMINILMPYSFANLHDLSWGTKGLETAEGHGGSAKDDKKGTFEDVIAAQKAAEEAAKKAAQEKENLEKRFSGFRTKLLVFWIVCNLSFIYTIQAYVEPNSYLTALYITIGLFNIWRFIGSTTYLFTYALDKVFSWCHLKRKLRKEMLQERRMQKQQQQQGQMTGATAQV